MNKLKLIVTAALIIFLLQFLVLSGCETPKYASNDPTSENDAPYIKINNLPPTGIVGANIPIEIEYHLYAGYPAGEIVLEIYPSTGLPNTIKTSYLGTQSSVTRTIQVTCPFPVKSNYNLQAYIDAPGKGEVYTEQYAYQIKIEAGNLHTFPIVELLVGNEDLWPNYKDANIDFNGRNAVYNAFNDCSVGISLKSTFHTKTGPDPTFLETDDMDAWVRDTYFANSQYDLKTTIVCALEVNYPDMLVGDAYGFETDRDDVNHFPRICFIFNARIKNSNYPEDQKVFFRIGTLIHELGHAAGISGDGTAISPSHSGTNMGICVMNPVVTASIAPLFCAGHIWYIDNIDWTQLNP